MTRAVGALVVVVACGGGTVAHHARPVGTGSADASNVNVDAAVIEAGPSALELLAARHDRVAPGTRELVREEIDLARAHERSLAAFDADTCVRAVFDADAPTAITLVDARGMALGAADATRGAIGAQGPVCFRKGDVATFRFNGQSRLRLVVWASP